MKKNMGITDRVIRLIIAGVIIVLYPTAILGSWGILAMILAAIFLLTSFISFCPLYVPFGISTCNKKNS